MRLRRFGTIILAALGMILLPSPAVAQTVEISGGAVWTGGYEAGTRDATESPNSSTGGSPLTLFTTSSRVPAAAGFEGRATVYFGSRVAAEGVFQYAKPEVRVRVGDDFENAAAETVVGGISSYLFGGSLVYHFGSGRIVPFVLGGAGYVRLLDEDAADVITGNEVHAGGGVKVWFTEGQSRLGLRADVQVSARSKNPGFEDKRRVLPAVSGGLVYRF